MIDLTGQRFGRLVAIEVALKRGNRRWICRCDCGTTKPVLQQSLLSGLTHSCGCLRREATAANNRTHGLSHRAEYQIWCGMKQRCEYPPHICYARYGGRGIRVCERWQDFAAFLADMGPRPSTKHSLDRIDSNGDYSPDNCRWSTSSEQASNTRRTRLVTFRGETLPASHWADRLGLDRNMVLRRIREGWSAERALTEPIRHHNPIDLR